MTALLLEQAYFKSILHQMWCVHCENATSNMLSCSSARKQSHFLTRVNLKFNIYVILCPEPKQSIAIH